MKGHRAEWKDRRERVVAAAWWAANYMTKHTRASVIKLNAIISPRTGTLLKLFDKNQQIEFEARTRALRESAARDWNAKLNAARAKPRGKRKITSREV